MDEKNYGKEPINYDIQNELASARPVRGPAYVTADEFHELNEKPAEPEVLRDDVPDDWYTLTDDNISEERLAELKHNDIDKPPNVTTGCWLAPREITGRHLAVANLTAIGLSQADIAKEVGLSPMRVGQIQRHPKIRDIIKDKRQQYFGEARDYIRSLVSKSVGVIDDILESHDAKDSVKLDASKYVIDQAIGKAQQSISVQSESFLKDVMNRLDMGRPDIKQIATTKTKDDMDAMVDAIIVEDVKVGVRSDEV